MIFSSPLLEWGQLLLLSVLISLDNLTIGMAFGAKGGPHAMGLYQILFIAMCNGLCQLVCIMGGNQLSKSFDDSPLATQIFAITPCLTFFVLGAKEFYDMVQLIKEERSKRGSVTFNEAELPHDLSSAFDIPNFDKSPTGSTTACSEKYENEKVDVEVGITKSSSIKKSMSTSSLAQKANYRSSRDEIVFTRKPSRKLELTVVHHRTCCMIALYGKSVTWLQTLWLAFVLSASNVAAGLAAGVEQHNAVIGGFLEFVIAFVMLHSGQVFMGLLRNRLNPSPIGIHFMSGILFGALAATELYF